MDEAYVDYVADDPDAGIVNNASDFPEITRDVLVEANENGGETNISTGWHAIEFLLWGQDTVAGQPGQRPVTDYTTAANADRRAAYLTEATDLLVADLKEVRDQWARGHQVPHQVGQERQRLGRQDPARHRGAERGRARRRAHRRRLETKDQEDEHSCFSDNTNADVVGDVVGIRQVYLADCPTASPARASATS